MKTCDHCGKLCKKRVAVIIDGDVAMVGSGCAHKFKRANRADLIGIYQANYMATEDDILKKYPDRSNEISYFKSRDPSGNLRYLKWEMKILVQSKVLQREIADVVDLFHRFSQNLEKKDIYSYDVSEFIDLRDKLFSIERNSELKSLKKERYKTEPPVEDIDFKRIYESNKFLVLHIMTKKASVYYGRGTKWCISMADRPYFEDYEDEEGSVFFFVIDKLIQDKINKNELRPKNANRLYKVAINVKRGNHDDYDVTDDDGDDGYRYEFWDASDEEITEYVGEKFNFILRKAGSIVKKCPYSIAFKLTHGKATKEEYKEALEKARKNTYKLENLVNINLQFKYDKESLLENEKILERILSTSQDYELFAEAAKIVKIDILKEKVNKCLDEIGKGNGANYYSICGEAACLLISRTENIEEKGKIARKAILSGSAYITRKIARCEQDLGLSNWELLLKSDDDPTRFFARGTVLKMKQR